MIRPYDDSLLQVEHDDLLDSLSEQQQERLGELLENYLDALEGGQEVDRQQMLLANPDLTTVLEKYLNSIDELHQAGQAVASSDSSTSQESNLRAAVEDHLPQSSRLGDYVIKEEIGRGGMGVVYAAEQISLGRRVALKTLPFAAVLDPKQVARFKNEAQAAAGLHHPNIVPVYGVGSERGVYYYSMQLIEGQSLEEAIAQLREQQGEESSIHSVDANKTTVPMQVGGHFSTQKSIRSREFANSVARLGQQAAAGLHYAHENGVVHRDIKPSNLMLDASSKLWITDFGLARITNASNLTVSGDMIGTARYMSPEQAGGRLHEVDHRSDIYSLGITLYELLTLRPAFDASSRRDLLLAVEHETPVPPRKLNPSIPVDLETIVLKAIEKGRGDRYTSAAEFAEDLEHFLGGRPTIAKRPGWTEHTFRWANRHRRGVGMITLALLTMLAFVSASVWMISAERKETEKQAAQTANYLRETQRVVDNFGAMVEQRLEHLPGSGPLRIELLGELEKYYTGFLAEAADDPTLAIDLAKTRFRLAAVHQRMGDLERAHLGYEKALIGFQDLQHQYPNDPNRAAEVALCQNNLAQVAAKRNDRTAARDWYLASIAAYRPLANSGHQPSLRGLSRTQMNLGLMLSVDRDPKAGEMLQNALDSLTTLASESPDDLNLVDQLALCENNLASTVMKDDLDQARRLLESAVKRYEWLATQRPASPEHQSDHALTLGNLAVILARLGEDEKASDLFQQVIQRRDQLLALEPGVSNHHFNAVIANQRAAQFWFTNEDLDLSKLAYSRALEILRARLQIAPEEHWSLSNLGRTSNGLAAVEQKQGNFPEALELLHQAVRYQALALKTKDNPNLEVDRELMDRHRLQIDLVRSSMNESSTKSPVGT